MNPALLFLLVRSMRGRIVRALRLLRQPKYIIGALGFVAWMALTTAGVWMDWARGEDVSVQFGAIDALHQAAPEIVVALQLAASLALTVGFTLWWLVPLGSSSLDLKEEELHILMPAPVKRRHLIQYAVLRSQPGVLFGCLIMTVFLSAGGPARRLLWFVGIWLMLTNWDLHSKGRALWNAKQEELPRSRALARRALLIAGILALWIALGLVVAGLVGDVISWQPPADYEETEELLRAALAELGPLLEESLLGWLVLPFVWVTEPLFTTPAASPGAVALSWVAPALMLVVQNEWVVRSQARFEEAALAHARKKAQKADATSRYWKTSLRLRQRTPFPLAPVGPPEVAVFWKNVMQIHRWPLVYSLGLGVLGCLAVGVLPPLLDAPGWIYGVLAGLAVFLLLSAPLIFGQGLRNDLRMDLLKFEVVRPWPIRGWRLVAAEVAAPAALAMLGVLLGAGVLLAVDLGTTLGDVRLGDSDVAVMGRMAGFLGVPHLVALPLVLLGLLPLLGTVAALSASMANLATLFFPGWIQLGPQAKNQGAATFGQNIVMFFGLGLALLLSTLPSVLLVGAIVAIQVFVAGIPVSGWELPVLGLVGATPMGVAAALMIRGAGGLWDRLDPSREILEASG